MANRKEYDAGMDEFGCYDYKKPPNDIVQDMRTSYYRGHRYITDTRLGNKMNAKFSAKNCYVRDPLLYEKLRSEYGANYEWKYPEPDKVGNPKLPDKIHLIKSYDEKKLRFIQKPMKPIVSVTQETYAGKQNPPDPFFIHPPQPTPVATTKLSIDRSKPSYSKYLDPTATTMRLSYVKYNPSELQGGIGAHDNITFWNWEELVPKMKRVIREKDSTMCDDFPATDCPKRREYQNQLKCVPHTGLITEVRENYLDPKHRKDYKDFDTTDVLPLLVNTPFIGTPKTTEYSMYGSGEPVLKYV